MNLDISQYYSRIIGTVIVLLIFWGLRVVTRKVVKKVSSISEKTDRRSKLISKYVDILMSCFLVFLVLLIWGVDSKSVMTYLGTIVAFIGVALFAQWSILSNITAGIIMFFSFPFKIGDKIRIQDKDLPIEAEIEDIKAFHTILVTDEGEIISFPNSLFLQKSVVIIKSY